MTVSFPKEGYMTYLINSTQGGVVEMSEQARKEYSLEAMSEFWTKRSLLKFCLPSPQTTEICLWKSPKPNPRQLTPPAVDQASSRSKARSLEGRWAMLVSLIASSSVE